AGCRVPVASGAGRVRAGSAGARRGQHRVRGRRCRRVGSAARDPRRRVGRSPPGDIGGSDQRWMPARRSPSYHRAVPPPSTTPARASTRPDLRDAVDDPTGAGAAAGGARRRVRAGWRLLVGLAMLAVLVTAQLTRGDDWFPLGTLGQYAYPRDPDGVVVNTYLTGTTTTGEEVRIGLTARSAGVTRVELEVALGDLRDDPSMLAGIAEVWEANHPGVELATMTVRQTLHQMADGALAAPPEERVVLTWEVP